ncbi:putative arginine-trna-protein transferase protein [Neofusicoccum parvum UCRNP2]|uniref:Arginine-tRNA-protein transferase n=2 Tax=Neofusicoccum parvum TaxID=310453 RepID=A0ACB5S8I2_9PEZI|nr:putative arginine-trna-protein transferase protein [Neofusicoccum parvum UCRNP2]GME29076.1 arginine-tRNA-protein transferase [Neofusicoccum parvum]
MQAPDAGAGPASFLTPLGASYYVKSKSLDVAHYQALIDRGWRRYALQFHLPHQAPFSTNLMSGELAARITPSGESYISEAKKLHPKSKEEKARQRNGFHLCEVIHEAEYSNLKRPPEPAHRFEVSLEPDNFTEEKFQLFSNYQQAVHHDLPHEVTRGGFKRFLCDSPLDRRTAHGTSTRLGSFHQCYRFDGRLIAIAVLDLLPHAVSGVYFIYHSDFEKFSFGKISALREAALAEESGLQFYYMGYYIHNCAKMRYKADYHPQYVLDPESYEWNKLDDGLRKSLDANKYVSPSRQKEAAQDPDSGGDTPMREKVTSGDFDGKHLDSPVLAVMAADEGLSLMELGMPGVMKPDQLSEQVNLGKIKIAIPKAGLIAHMEVSQIIFIGSVLC